MGWELTAVAIIVGVVYAIRTVTNVVGVEYDAALHSRRATIDARIRAEKLLAKRLAKARENDELEKAEDARRNRRAQAIASAQPDSSSPASRPGRPGGPGGPGGPGRSGQPGSGASRIAAPPRSGVARKGSSR